MLKSLLKGNDLKHNIVDSLENLDSWWNKEMWIDTYSNIYILNNDSKANHDIRFAALL